MKKIILFLLYFFLIFSGEHLKASSFKKTFSEDQKGINSTFRKCTVLTSKNIKYLSCKGIVNNFDKIYLNNIEGAQFGEYLRYQIGAETSWFLHSGYYSTKDNIEIGGWVRKDDKRLLLGAFDARNKKWIAASFNQELKSQTNLNTNEIKAYINKASYYYQNALKIENEIIKISYEIEESDLSSFKNYWWVVILIGLGVFIIYTQTKKDIPKFKKIEKIVTQNQKREIDANANILIKFFRGNLSLAISYWGFLFSWGVITSVTFVILEKSKNDILVGLFSIFILATYVYLYIGTWRSAENYKKEKIKKKLGYGWAIAAQVAMVLGIIRFVVEFIKAFK
jgi:hypothetical protein